MMRRCCILMNRGSQRFGVQKQIEGVPYIEGLSFDTAEVEIGKVLPVEDDAILRNWQRHPDISEKCPVTGADRLQYRWK